MSLIEERQTTGWLSKSYEVNPRLFEDNSLPPESILEGIEREINLEMDELIADCLSDGRTYVVKRSAPKRYSWKASAMPFSISKDDVLAATPEQTRIITAWCTILLLDGNEAKVGEYVQGIEVQTSNSDNDSAAKTVSRHLHGLDVDPSKFSRVGGDIFEKII